MIASKLIRLRALQADDRATILEWRNAPSVASAMFTDHLIHPDEHEAWFEWARVDDETHCYRVIEQGHKMVGLQSLSRIDTVRRSCVWGGYLAPEVPRGAGLGSAALFLMLRVAFDELDLHRVTVEALDDNLRALKVYERLGFRREAYLRDAVWKGGRPQDVVGLALLAAEWSMLSPELASRFQTEGLVE